MIAAAPFAKTLKYISQFGPTLQLSNYVRSFASSGGRASCREEDKIIIKIDACGYQKVIQKPKEPKKYTSMWENPDCCLDPCPDLPVRLDVTHYRPSNKMTRKYTQTWVECPYIKAVTKKVCCKQKVIYPPFVRRPRKEHPPTACPLPQSLLDRACKRHHSKKCIKITMPCCAVARDPPNCTPTRRPSDCKKLCTPYPSFSECTKKRPKPRHPTECGCLNLMSMCEAYARQRQLAIQKKVLME